MIMFYAHCQQTDCEHATEHCCKLGYPLLTHVNSLHCWASHLVQHHVNSAHVQECARGDAVERRAQRQAQMLNGNTQQPTHGRHEREEDRQQQELGHGHVCAHELGAQGEGLYRLVRKNGPENQHGSLLLVRHAKGESGQNRMQRHGGQRDELQPDLPPVYTSRFFTLRLLFVHFRNSVLVCTFLRDCGASVALVEYHALEQQDGEEAHHDQEVLQREASRVKGH
mmetsp:Transcript_37635/g.72121  ORF Transcript_37635/g.72121 Transcript_37635/m.72121 type:complete len:225 (+) Transcript_37635:151-825(+)